MRARVLCAVGLALVASGCGPRSTNERTYVLQGQVLSVESDRLQASIKHEEIKGLMPAMTMPYKMKDATVLDGVKPGDLINAKLTIVLNDAFLSDVKKVGEAPLEKASAEAPAPAPSGLELLKPGDAVPSVRFVDENGRNRAFNSFKGSTVLITFIYTRCPLPTFCPMMDRHFATIQKTIESDPSLSKVHLVSVSFDPLTDTPPVLKKHARELGADPARWTFLTGDRDTIDRFSARFGVSVSRALNDPRDISHTLRTAIVDPDGKIVKVYVGNEWAPNQVLADLK